MPVSFRAFITLALVVLGYQVITPVFASEPPSSEREAVTQAEQIFAAAEDLEIPARRNHRRTLARLKEIFIDVRGSRGGKGDVAAGFLTAEDLVRRHHYAGRITFIMDEESQLILQKLIGQRLTDHTNLPARHFQFRTLESISEGEHPPADLYLSLAHPSGLDYHSTDMEYIDAGKPRRANSIPIHKNTVRIHQTVLGNTENTNAYFPNSTAQIGEFLFVTPPAGLGTNEAGIYYDTVALRLRDQSPETIHAALLSLLGKRKHHATGKAIRAVVDGSALKGSQMGIVYGITSAAVHAQFETYLADLSRKAVDSGSAYTLLTPSGFSLAQVQDAALRNRISVINPLRGGVLPETAERGRIYIVKTGSLPHDLFTTLLAASEVPPIVAGDGAMSAAIAIGKPFLMTQVQWNRENIKNLFRILWDDLEKEPDGYEVVEKILQGDLGTIDAVSNYKKIYKRVFKKIPSLTDSLLATTAATYSFATKKNRSVEEVLRIKSNTARVRELMALAAHGSKEAFAELFAFFDRPQPPEVLFQLSDSFRKMVRDSPASREIFARYLLATPDPILLREGIETLFAEDRALALRTCAKALEGDFTLIRGTLNTILYEIRDLNDPYLFRLLREKVLPQREPYLIVNTLLFLLDHDPWTAKNSKQMVGYLRGQDPALLTEVFNILESENLREAMDLSAGRKSLLVALADSEEPTVRSTARNLLKNIRRVNPASGLPAIQAPSLRCLRTLSKEV